MLKWGACMEKESKRFLWSLLGIVLLFFTVQNFEAVKVGFNMLLELILPLIYGCAIAFVLNLIVRQLEKVLTFGPFQKKNFRRAVSILLALLILAGVLAALVAGLVPEIKDSGSLLVERLPGYIQKLVDFCVVQLGLPESWFTDLENLDVGGLVEQLFQNGIIQQVLQSGGSLVGGAVTAVLDFLLGLCFSIYLLMQKESLIHGIKRLSKVYLKPAHHERLMQIGITTNEIYSKFISGQCLDAMILGAMVTVALAIFGIPYALLIGIVVAFTALVPVVGAFLGGAIGVFLLMMVSVKEALVFLAIFLILQQVGNRLIYPHVVGNAVGLPAIWIFAAIIVGGNFGGIFGMILAIPLFAMAYTLVAQDLRKREAAMTEEE